MRLILVESKTCAPGPPLDRNHLSRGRPTRDLSCRRRLWRLTESRAAYRKSPKRATSPAASASLILHAKAWTTRIIIKAQARRSPLKHHFAVVARDHYRRRFGMLGCSNRHTREELLSGHHRIDSLLKPRTHVSLPEVRASELERRDCSFVEWNRLRGAGQKSSSEVRTERLVCVCVTSPCPRRGGHWLAYISNSIQIELTLHSAHGRNSLTNSVGQASSSGTLPKKGACARSDRDAKGHKGHSALCSCTYACRVASFPLFFCCEECSAPGNGATIGAEHSVPLPP